jgi:hypothetical protein
MCCSTHPKLFTNPVTSLDGFITKKRAPNVIAAKTACLLNLHVYGKKREK